MQELLLLWPKIVSLKQLKLIQSWPKIHYCIFDFQTKYFVRFKRLFLIQKKERKLQSKCIQRNEYDFEQQREKKSSKQFEPLFLDELWVLTLNMMASILTSKYGGSVCSTDSILTDLCRFSAKAFSHSKVRGSTFN